MCRNSYNNRRNSDKYKAMKVVNSILRKNRMVLEELLGSNIERTSRELLLKKGFDPDYFTRAEIDRNGNLCYFCYEYRIVPISKKEFQLSVVNKKK